METRKFLVHYRYDGIESTQTFTTTGKANAETFRWILRDWCDDGDKKSQIIIYSWSLIEE